MANTRSAKKRIRSTAKKTEVNRRRKSSVRTAIRSAREAIAAGEVDAARTATFNAASQIDKAAGKNVLHKNTASRYKSRLMKRLAALEAGS